MRPGASIGKTHAAPMRRMSVPTLNMNEAKSNKMTLYLNLPAPNFSIGVGDGIDDASPTTNIGNIHRNRL